MRFFIIIPTLLIFGVDSFSQNMDTITINTFKVVDQKLPPAYKITQFDSSEINSSQHLSELLENHSTVFIKNYNPSMLSSVSFRGTGASHTNVLWNDLNVNSPMNGQVDFSLFPTNFTDNISIFYGASGLMTGSGSLGGSVNLSNQPKFNEGFKGDITQSIGSFGRYTTATNLSFSKKNWFAKTTLYLNSTENNFSYIDITEKDNLTKQQNNAEVQQYGLQQNVSYRIKNKEFGINLLYFNSERMLPKSLVVDTNYEKQQDASFHTALYHKGMFNQFKYKIVGGLLADQLIYTNPLASIYSKSNTYSINIKGITSYYLRYNFTLKNDVSIRFEKAKSQGYETEQSRFNNSWLMGLTKQFKRLTLNIHNRAIIVNQQAQWLAPTVGLQFSFLQQKNLKIKANHGINYNYPTFNDLYWNPGGNPNLKPEKAQMSELGIAFSSKKQLMNIEVTGFYSFVNDWIIWTPSNSGIWTPDNLKEVENRGLEATLKFQKNINKTRLGFRLNYAYTESTNLKSTSDFDNSKGKQLIYVPFHQFNTYFTAHFHSFTASYGYNYVGKRYITTDNDWNMPAYFISNITLSKQFKLSKTYHLIVGGRINNLFNQHYQSIAYRPMPGRNFMINLSLQIL